MLPKRDERRMEKKRAVVKFVLERQPKAKRVRTRKDDFHPHPGIDVREKRRVRHEILHQRHFVDEYILVPAALELVHVSSQLRHVVHRRHLDVCRLRELLIRQIANNLPEHRGLARAPQAIYNHHTVNRIPSHILHDVLQRIASLPFFNALGELPQCSSSLYIRLEVAFAIPRPQRARRNSLLQQKLLNCMTPPNLLSKSINFIMLQILALDLTVLFPLMIKRLPPPYHLAGDVSLWKGFQLIQKSLLPFRHLVSPKLFANMIPHRQPTVK